MASASSTMAVPVPARSLGRTARVYVNEAKYEFLKNLRLRVYSVSTIIMPTMFYVLFGLVLNRGTSGGFHVPTYLMATYGAFGVMGASLFGTAAGLAAERGLGWLQVKRASPMPPSAYFVGKIVMSMIFSTVVVVLLMILGVLFGGVQLTVLSTVKLLAILVAGSLPFCVMGLAIGYFAGPTSAPGVINLVYLPMSFCSGLWIPLMFLPKVLRDFAHYLPPYHLGQLALGVVGAGAGESAGTHWQYLLGFTLICLGIARYGFRRDEGKLYG